MSKLGKYSWIDEIVRDTRLKDPVKVTAIALSKYANSNDLENAHPGQERLAQDRGVSTKTIGRHLQELCIFGWIERTSAGSTSPKRNFADVYKLVFAQLTTRHLGVSWSEPEIDAGSPADHQTFPTTTGHLGTRPPDKTASTTGHLDVHPPSHIHPGLLHPSISQPSNTSVSGAAHAEPADDLDTFEAIEDWLGERLDGLEDREYSTVLGMWESGMNRVAILNKLAKDRGDSCAS